MAQNYGKKFESTFRQQWRKCFPKTFLYRVPDQVTGYKNTSQNPCDFFAYNSGIFWMLECKETKEGTLNFSKVKQLENTAFTDAVNYVGVIPIIIVWFSNNDKVVAVPVQEALKMKEDRKKSISLKMLEDKSYNIYEIPGNKLRVFMNTDYTKLLDWAKEQGLDK